MKKISVKILLAFSLLACLLGVSLQSIKASQNYKITYSPGTKGAFTQTLIDEYKTVYGENNVSVSNKSGSITINVEKEAAMPKVPTVEDINLKDARYYVRAGAWEPTSKIVTKSSSYVVKYNMLNKGKEYTIRFIDEKTKAEIASPIISMANVDDTITYSAKNIEGYTFDEMSKTMVISDNEKDNVLTFVYTGGKDRNVVTQTTTNETNVITPANPVVTPIVLPNADENITDPETIEPNETPQSNGNTNDNKSEVVEEEETPKAKLSSDPMTYVPFVAGGLVVIAGIVYIVVKNKTRKVN